MNFDILKKLSCELSVLLIDSDTLFLDIFASTLAPLFKSVRLAKTQQEAQEIYFTHFPDVIMMNIDAARSENFALLTSIREHSFIVPIIGFGKANSHEKITECLLAGMDECLEKSVGMNALIKTLYVQLRRYQIKSQIDQKDAFINTLLSSTKIGIAVIDTHGVFLECNNSYALMMDKSQEELLGKSWIESSDRDEKGKIIEALATVLKEGNVDSFRQINHHDKNQKSTLDVTLYLLPQKQKILMSVKDMTKEMTYLEQLEKASKAKNIFLANMSHEIRTPLNGVRGILDILSTTKLSEKQQSYVKLIQNSSASLLNIINDILDYSKIEAGKFTLESYSFAPKQILKNTVDLFHFSAQQNGTNLTYHINFDETLQVFGDAHRLTQILNNLVGNAVKFTKNGSIKVIGSTQEKDNKICLTLEIRDTGIGMNAKHLNTLFAPFNQADASSSRQYGGTGLGLAICRELCTLMNGDIRAESIIGEGSTFFVTIAFEHSCEIFEKKLVEPSQNRYFQAEGKVLVVDDNETNLIVATEYLSRYGLKFEKAYNGVEAIKKVKEEKFDLILMDVQMPLMDGHEATRQIRAFNATIPIVGLSASVMQEEHALCLAVGMNDNIAKPIVPELFEQVLASFLKHTWSENLNHYDDLKSIQISEEKREFYGIDEEEIRKKFRTDTKVKRFLSIFAEENKNFSDFIQEARGDYEELRKRLHYLKGVSGNASMPKLYEMCSALYAKSSLQEYEKGLPDILDELAAILKSIKITMESA